MKTAIFYFSGTGNSFDICQKLSTIIASDMFFIPNTNIQTLEQYKSIIIVSPIYAFGLPIPTEQFIKNIKLFKDKKYFVILNYGGFAANALYYTQNLFDKNELPLQNIYKMKMPENFTIVATVPKFFINRALKKSQKAIENIAKSINSNTQKRFHKNIFSFLDDIHNKVTVQWGKFAAGFSISNSCDGCGHCVEMCSANNIVLENEKPKFANNCVACLACYQRCPNQAINCGKRTVGKPRYMNPNIDFSKMK